MAAPPDSSAIGAASSLRAGKARGMKAAGETPTEATEKSEQQKAAPLSGLVALPKKPSWIGAAAIIPA